MGYVLFVILALLLVAIDLIFGKAYRKSRQVRQAAVALRRRTKDRI